MVAIIPMSRSFFRTSPALTPIARARSATVMTSEMRMTRLDARGTVISVFLCSFPGGSLLDRGRRDLGLRRRRHLGQRGRDPGVEVERGRGLFDDARRRRLFALQDFAGGPAANDVRAEPRLGRLLTRSDDLLAASL